MKKTILPEFWSAAKGKALEKKREYKELNLYLDSIRLRIMKIQRELEIEEVSVLSLIHIFVTCPCGGLQDTVRHRCQFLPAT